ncbi:hypothetical protein K1719_033339 [Acacia pycnantha]|nr:hypothetical protein K1719_033339 [Acacia pycnantha]
MLLYHPSSLLLLADVVAFVKVVGTLDEFCRGNKTKKRLRLKLADSKNNEVECTLFDNCASDAYMAYLQNLESPVVVLLNLARVGFSEDEGCSEVKAIVESVDVESVTPLVTPLDHSTISDLSQHVAPASIKGKIRITNKRNVVKDDLTTTSHVSSACPAEERVTKVIKQEK